MQGPALQNEGVTAHVMLKGERMSPTVGVMLQDGGGETSPRVLVVVVGELKGVLEMVIIDSVDEAWVWCWDAGCPLVACPSGSNVGNKVDEVLNIGMVNSVDPDKPSLIPRIQKFGANLVSKHELFICKSLKKNELK